MNILIQFPDKKTERLALEKLVPRFPSQNGAAGETAVPAPALSFLAEEGIRFTVVGPATLSSLRNLKPVSVGAILRPYPSDHDEILGEMLDAKK